MSDKRPCRPKKCKEDVGFVVCPLGKFVLARTYKNLLRRGSCQKRTSKLTCAINERGELHGIDLILLVQKCEGVGECTGCKFHPRNFQTCLIIFCVLKPLHWLFNPWLQCRWRYMDKIRSIDNHLDTHISKNSKGGIRRCSTDTI